MKSLNSACAASLLEQGIGSTCMGSSESDGRNGLLDSPCSTASSLSSLTPPATPFSGATSSKLQSVPLASLHQSSLLLRQLSEPSSVAANDYGCVLLDSGREYIALGELNYSNGQGSGQAGGVQAEMDFLENISGFGYANAAAADGGGNTTATTSYNGYNGAAPGNSYTEHSADAGVGAAAAAAAAASHANGALNYLGTPGKAAADIDPKEIDQYLMDQMLPMHPHPHPHPHAHGQPQSHPHAQHMPGQSPPPLNSSASLSSACSSASSQPVECLPSPYEHYEHISYPPQAQNGAGYAQHYATDQQQQQQHPQQQLSQQQQQHHHLWSTYVNP